MTNPAKAEAAAARRRAKPPSTEKQRVARLGARAALGFRAKFQLTLAGGTLFGDGKAQLLDLVDELGSLRQAARRMEMSYRHAWGLVRELDEAAGFAFLEHEGAGPRSRLRLTADGREFLAAFHAFRAPLDQLVSDRFDAIFPSSR